MSSESFNFVIVGAGSAGCVLANRLSADPGNRVLLLEAGPRDRSPWIHIPVGYAKTFYDPVRNWMYHTEADKGINHRKDYWPRGRVLGGSSSINALVFIRGQQIDFNHWRDSGAEGWGWQDVLPYFKRMESAGFGDPQFRGHHGPIHISRTDEHTHATNQYFLEGCLELGFSKNNDFNGETQEGVGYYQINTKNGRRISSARGYLTPVQSRKNLTVLTEAWAQRLKFSDNRCVGVEYLKNGMLHSVTADKEVILCAGAINSPQLLQCSGIGRGKLLQSLNIPVVADLAAVGENLQDHLGLNYYFRSKIPTLNDQFTSLFGCISAGMRYLFTRSGPMAISVNHSGGFVKSSPQRPHPNLQLYFQPTSYINAKSGTRPVVSLDRFSAFNIGVSQCRPTSKGSITISSADATVGPVIKPNYLSTQYDVDEMLEGAKLVRTIAATPAVQKMTVEEILPGSECDTDEKILEDIRQRSGTVFHPVGTCGMGGNSDYAVVNSRLQVFNIRGLRVADASIFPNIISGNTNAACMMVAEKASDLILADY